VKLLRERPDLAVLVKSVSIAIAVHIILKSVCHTGKANDTADGMVSDEATAAQSDTTTEQVVMTLFGQDTKTRSCWKDEMDQKC
jgi:hypothetical protein